MEEGKEMIELSFRLKGNSSTVILVEAKPSRLSFLLKLDRKFVIPAEEQRNAGIPLGHNSSPGDPGIDCVKPG